MDGWYYLHTNNSLIFKRFKPDAESPFVRRIWPLDVTSRENAWIIAIEAGALGVEKERLTELAEKWKLTDEDAMKFANRGNFRLFKYENKWCAGLPDFKTIETSQHGIGDTALEAFIELAKQGAIDKGGKECQYFKNSELNE